MRTRTRTHTKTNTKTNTTRTLATLTAIALIAPAALLQADDDDKQGRPDHDVRVRLKVKGRKKPEIRVRLTVKNKGREDLEQVEVTLHDGDPSDPVWSDVISLDRKDRFRLKLRVPSGDVGAWLTAECRIVGEEDEKPGDNEDTAGGPAAPTQTAAMRGRDLYVPLCAACHGPDGRGGTSDENIAREDWDEFLEAFREGEDGMPLYPSFGAREAKDIAAYLRDPGSVPPTSPPPADPPADPPTDPPAAPTYTANVKPILDASCVACHRAGSAAAGIALDTYASASAGASASLSSIQAGRMPLAAPLPSAQTQVIADWITAGKPE